MVAAAKLLRHAGRKRSGLFLAEGANMVEAALARGVVTELYATESAHDRFEYLLRSVPVRLVTERASKSLSDTVTPVGLVAVCSMPRHGLDAVLAVAPRLVAVAVETSEPGNAGTLIRLADAMGADAVVLAGHGVDPFNGKCLRASAGSIFALPVLETTDTAALIGALRVAGLQVLATTVDGEARLDEVELSPPTAWLFGSEAHGLPADIAGLADARVRIPMSGAAESLNVAGAAAICLYESSRVNHRAG